MLLEFLMLNVIEMSFPQSIICGCDVRMEPQMAQALLERMKQERRQQAGQVSPGMNRDQDILR